MSKILQREDLQQINTPKSIASLFGKLGYDASCQPIDVEDLELSSKSADAVTQAYFIANQTDANLQVLLFQLSPQCWTSDSAAVARMSAIANSLCQRPSHFLLLATIDYRQLLLVSPHKTLDDQMELQLTIAKILINLNDPSFYEIQLLEKIAAQNLTSRSLSLIQHRTLSLARQEKRRFEDDPVRSYLQRIGRIKLLSAREEILLGRKIQRLFELETEKEELKKQLAREPSKIEWAEYSHLTLADLYKDIKLGHLARNKLVEANLRLVVSIAKQYKERGLDFLDLIQFGNLGLIKASEKFDPTKGYRFSTYAYWWIRQSITRAIQDYSRLIHIPGYCWEKYNRVKKARQLLIQEGKTSPSIQKIAMYSDLTVEDARELIKIFQATVSLDILAGESRDTRLEELILSDTIYDNSLEEIALKDYVEKILSNLNPQEREVIRLRFGLNGNSVNTLQAIGEKLGGLSRERIRQVEAKALKKMKNFNNQQKLKQILNIDITTDFNHQSVPSIQSLPKIKSTTIKPTKDESKTTVTDYSNKVNDVRTKFNYLNESRNFFPKDDLGLKQQVIDILRTRAYKTIAHIIYIIWGISSFQDHELYELAKEELLRIFDYQFPQY